MSLRDGKVLEKTVEKVNLDLVQLRRHFVQKRV